MQSLSNPSASADPSSGIPPKLKPFKVLTEKLSSTAFQGILGLTVFMGILSMAPEAQAHYLRRGAVGPSVAEVQSALGIPADGIFGRHTQLAVMEFQRSCGLQVDGIVGPETWSALFGGGSSSVASSDVSYPVGNNILVPGIEPPSEVLPPAVIGPYVVVIPGASPERLTDVKKIVPDAVIDGAARGSFINAGGYPNYASAREVAGRLRGFGFDARVDYFQRYRESDNPPGSENLSSSHDTGSYTYTPCTDGQC